VRNDSEESSIFSRKLLSPLVRNHKRVGGDMIVVVEIIAGRLMRDALRDKDVNLLPSMLGRNKDLPSGNAGCHLET
jgi:hypothetical protein